MKQRVNISVTSDTAERLKQYAWEHHTTVSQAITDWIWSAKVKYEQVHGQIMLEECRKPVLRQRQKDGQSCDRLTEETRDSS